MLKRIVLAFLLLMCAPVIAHAQSGLVIGFATGSLMSGGDSYGSATASILFTADDKTLKTVNPMEVRLASTDRRPCFGGKNSENKGRSLGELFNIIMAKMPKNKKRTVLQIARIFDPGNPQCAVIWFSYIEEDGKQ